MTASLVLLLAVAAAFLAAHVASEWIARRFLIVSAAEYLVLGILLGPQFAGVLGHPLLESLSPLSTLAIGWIGAMVGTGFQLRWLLRIPARSFRVGFTESAVTFLAVAGLEYLALHWSFPGTHDAALVAAIALGSMAVASSGAGMSVVARVLGTRGTVIEQIEVASLINGFVAIATFGLLLCVHHTPMPASRPLTSTEWAVISIGIGVVGGLLFHVFLGDRPDTDRNFVALGGAVILVSGAATYLRLSPLVAGFFFGVTLVNSTPRPRALIATMERVEKPFYYVLLLFGGAAWAPSQHAWIAPVALFVAVRAASKIGGSRLGARLNGALDELGPEWGRALLGQGRLALAIGLSFLYQETLAYPNVVFTAGIASILVTEFFSARLVRSAVNPSAEGPAQTAKAGATL